MIENATFRLNEAGLNYEMITHRSFQTKLMIVYDEANCDFIKKMIGKYLEGSANNHLFVEIECLSVNDLKQL
jgi:hypothetical protein